MGAGFRFLAASTCTLIRMPTLIPLPAFADNYIWTVVSDGGAAVFIDPGEAAPVIAAASQHGLRPRAILLTHHHADHIGAAAELAERFAMPVFAPDDARITCATHRVGEGEQIIPPGTALRFSVMHLPGHTLSHVAYTGAGLAFTGDTLFSLGCGRLFEGSPAQMLNSLQRLAALPQQTRLCCGHEYTLANAAFARCVDPDNPALQARSHQAHAQRAAGLATLPVSLQSELACNPFLRCHDARLAARVAAHAGSNPADELETFTALRAWKDGFRPS